MEQHRITVEKSARYFTLGKSDGAIKTVLFVCHGYAQLANEFLVQFESVSGNDLLVIAPEGLHRFYQRGGGDKVVASWMTKEDRDDDIRDYTLFLDKVYANVMQDLSPDVKTIALGFSQGAATVSRWTAAGNSPIDELVLWCGFFPPDLPPQGIPSSTALTVVTASNDKFISAEQEQEQLATMKKLTPALKHIKFEGGHVIDQQTLLQLFTKS